MDLHRIALLRDSFGRLAPIAEPAAALFYRRLMEMDPSTRPLFARTDMAAQGVKLMQALGMAIATLERAEQLLPKLREMAQRHVAYGVQREHYASVGAALLWTLGKGLGDGFTPEVEDAWAEAYAILADVMMDAAYCVRAA
ncbi:globin family protein [Sediminicoccus sp. KRV36]|uniref:globin family protein n=1 Tax=Sediminicoccus sp. KRV36 TaxID=3133721 RepID=UPI00200ED714|nr:globin family protein [Sediminicoccus rosea]UPY38360.1 globin domain-containing protein [Sediminicoccus rosea]